MWYLLAGSLALLPLWRKASLLLLVVTILLALWQGTLSLPGVMVLLTVAGLYYYAQVYRRSTPQTRVLAELVVVLIAAGLMLHLLPGFHNQLVVSQVKVGPESAPFSFYYNIDKALLPFVLLAALPQLLQRPPLITAKKIQWVLLFLAIPLLLYVAVWAGGLKTEPHFFPQWLPAFILANLFFVSLAEEALFRGYLQCRLSQWLGPYGGLFAAAVLFGLVHFQGGLLLVLFASLAGVIYGLAWLWSGSVWVSALVHFAFNMLHLLFFTYPVWRPVSG